MPISLGFGLGLGFFPAGAPAAFTPASIPNLYQWYRADLGITTVSGAVSQWNDQSGNGFNATQGTAGNRPAYVTGAYNGHQTLRFNGLTNSRNLIGTLGGTTPTTFTIAVVHNPIVIGSNRWIYENSDSAASANRSYGVGVSSGHFRQFKAVGVGPSATGGPDSTQEFFLGEETATTDRAVAVNNGTAVTQTQSVTVNTLNNFKIGCLMSLASFYNGDICEIIIYSTTLTTAQKTQLYNYAKSFWAIP